VAGVDKPGRLTALSRQFYRRAMDRATREVHREDLARSAIVFSPHPDDETLGCGGTIIKKIRAGADVTIVFMTDGHQSHAHVIPSHEFKSIRTSEALAASRVLGVGESRVVFLEFKDGELSMNRDVAIPQVVEMLQRQRPDQVFIPYRGETPPDHVATNRIVVSALRRWGGAVTVYEYPIWFWRQWPWVSVPLAVRRETFATLKSSIVAGLGLRLLWDFRCSVCVEDVLELKRVALNQHESQMTRLIPDSDWATLDDVWNGEFLLCLFQDREIFHRYGLLGEKEGTY